MSIPIIIIITNHIIKNGLTLTLRQQQTKVAADTELGIIMELARNLPLLLLLSSLCMLSAIAQLQPTASQREKMNGKARYNEDLFEGDIKISSKEIETYYEDVDEPSTNVRNFKTVSQFVLGRSRQHFHG